jgi:leucyl-tRNA synthetase
MPVDLYVGGVEHAVLHLLYARFWHKVLFDCGYVSTREPFQMLRNQGLVVARSYQHTNGSYVPPEEVREKEGRFFQIGTNEELCSQVEKMSKSKLNGVTPDSMLEEFGADSLRMYEMFMGPFDKEKVWNTDAVSGCRRFLNRFYDLVMSEKVSDAETDEALKLGHRLVYLVEKEIGQMQFNTAIAKMMEFINAFAPLSSYPRSVLKMLTRVLYPFAPHIAEEAWEHLGGKESLTWVPFPTCETRYLTDETVLYVVQVNGRVRGKWMLPKDRPEEELLTFIRSQPTIAKHLTGPISRVVYVPNKLLSIVCDV